MADPQDQRKPVKTPLELFLAKLLPKPPAPPEPSYFRADPGNEPDREEERRQAARSRQASAAQHVAVEAKDRARLDRAFAPVSLSDEIKLDQRIAAIAQEDLREAAMEAREDARELLELNRAKIDEVFKQDREFWKPYDLSRPAPEDTARQQNQARNEAVEKLTRVTIAIHDTMEQAIAAAEVESWKRTPQLTYEQGQLTHQPPPPETPSGWLTETYRAAGIGPTPPRPPGQDIPR